MGGLRQIGSCREGEDWWENKNTCMVKPKEFVIGWAMESRNNQGHHSTGPK